MDFALGETYSQPADSDPSWFLDALREVRRVRVGDVPITLALRGGTQITGDLVAADTSSDPEDHYGSVFLESRSDPDRLDEYPCREIVAFRLVPPPPIDHSDELRG